MGLDRGAVVVRPTVNHWTRSMSMSSTVLGHRGDLVSLRDGVLNTGCGLHAVRHSFINSRGWGSRGKDAVLESLSVTSKAPLLGRKNSFLILQTPLHYELILVRTVRPLS